MTPPQEAERGPVGGRKEVGGAESSQRHPPHLDKNMQDAPLQEEHPSPDDVTTLPATAHGQDKEETSELAQPIDDESMYDRRREEDKDNPPSQAIGPKT